MTGRFRLESSDRLAGRSRRPRICPAPPKARLCRPLEEQKKQEEKEEEKMGRGAGGARGSRGVARRLRQGKE